MKTVSQGSILLGTVFSWLSTLARVSYCNYGILRAAFATSSASSFSKVEGLRKSRRLLCNLLIALHFQTQFICVVVTVNSTLLALRLSEQFRTWLTLAEEVLQLRRLMRKFNVLWLASLSFYTLMGCCPVLLQCPSFFCVLCLCGRSESLVSWREKCWLYVGITSDILVVFNSERLDAAMTAAAYYCYLLKERVSLAHFFFCLYFY